MFERLRNFFGMHVTEDVYNIFDDAARKIADYNDLEHFHHKMVDSYRKLWGDYDGLKKRYDGVIDEYEKLSKKYFALKIASQDKVPDMKDEFAPKCVRKEQETWSYFRLRDESYIPALKKFLRHSGHWTLHDDPEMRALRTVDHLEPIVEFDNEKKLHVVIPFGSVFMVNDAAPKTEWLVMPETTFNKEWMPA